MLGLGLGPEHRGTVQHWLRQRLLHEEKLGKVGHPLQESLAITEAGSKAFGKDEQHKPCGSRLAPAQENDRSSSPGALVTAAQVGLMVVACKKQQRL